MKNHQNANPFVPNMQPLINSPAFMNAANNFVPFQNNQLGLPQMGLAGHLTQQNQFHMGFGPQNSAGNMNYNPVFPVQGQMMQNAAQVNFSHPQGQILAQNILNMLQQHNLNMNTPNGQFPGPGPLQNMNQQLPMQVPNASVVPFGMPPGSQPMVRFPNQVPGAMVPQNPIFSENPRLGIVPGNQLRPQVNQDKKNMVPLTSETNTSMSLPFASQQLQGNPPSPLNSNSNQLHHRKHSQSSAFTKSQANPNNNYKANVLNSNWKGSPRKNFKNKPNRGRFQGGFQKSKFHDNNNGKRKSGFPEEHKGKGVNSEVQFKQPKSSQMGRSISVTYTEQEIQQWREARRKRYPTKDNIEKKQGDCLRDSKVIGREVLRNELKEILAKQAELGVEVAEISSYYLADSQKKFQEKDEKRTFANNKRKNQNKFNGRPNKNGRFAKKQKLADKDSSSSPSLKKKTPTLLQKLLSADIKRDKSHLLQVFRFMAMNSFFKDYPDKPLTYPSVMVKEIGLEGAQGKSVHTEKDEDSNNADHVTPHEEAYSCIERECDNREEIEESDEEEGEIID